MSQSKTTIKRSLVSFLNRMKSVKNSSFTHTSITEPAGSFYIHSEYINEFHKLYQHALKAGCDLYLTEKHVDVSPVLIDFDFRFPLDQVERKYDLAMLREIVVLYMRELGRYVELDDPPAIYVMEKSSPVVLDSKNVVKDGVHIVIPEVVTRPSVQLLVRKRMLEHIQNVIAPMECSNSVDDIFDECVINKNNWQMYGSRKPGSEPYRVTHIWRVVQNDEQGEFIEELPLANDDAEYVATLSIRNKLIESPLRTNDPAFEDVEAYDKQLLEESIKRESRSKLYNKICDTQETNFSPSEEGVDISFVRSLIGILDKNRVDRYNDWIRLGWCLRNISTDLLEDWDEISQASEKYEPGTCERYWTFMRKGGLGIGSLHMWAKQDNRQEYQKLISKDISKYIRTSISGLDYDIGMVIVRMFKHRYRCANIRNNLWYEYRDHRWREQEKAYKLFYQDIPTLVFDQYTQHITHLEHSTIGMEDQNERDLIIKNCDTFRKIRAKFKNTSFTKDKMYKECSGQMLEEKFFEKLDENPSLLCFENGVYDLDACEFREGRPEDYTSYTTGINYIEFDEENPYVDQVNDFIEKVLPDPDVREYVLLLFASILDGTNRDENFHIWTGSGSNGKSKIVELFQQCIGDYGCIFNVSMLTQKRGKSNECNPELAIAKGKRFAVLQEPEENEKMNVGVMKEMTGGDTLQCRGLYKDPFKFKPQFTCVLTCNHMPEMPANDGGTWRRVRRVEFTSKFLDAPNPQNPNEFKIDRELSQKFAVWRETFMTILLRYHQKYKIHGLNVPEKVNMYTKEYQRKNDVIAEFCENYVRVEENASTPVAQLFATFREFLTNDNIRGRNIRRSDFQETLSKTYGNATTVSGKLVWKGIKQIMPSSIKDDEDDC
jgi:P4 family phage/plasmid primase-like protien